VVIAVALPLLLAPAIGAARPAARCIPRDEFVPIAHGDGGGVWIPREVSCGGAAPLILVLHGSNTDRVNHVSLGGGRALGKLARRLVDQRRARPVLLAEPVHFRSCGTGLYDEQFDFPAYRVKLEALLAIRRIRVTSYAVMGHSGAGCCGGVHRAAAAFGKIRLLGLVDVCYGSEAYATAVRERYDASTVVLSISRGDGVFSGYPRFESRILGRQAAPVPCDRQLYRECLRSSGRPTFAFSTTRRDRRYHSEIPADALRTVLTRFFQPPRRSRVPTPAPDKDPADAAPAVTRSETQPEARSAGAGQ
jgi:hypothetical protein